MLELNAMRYFVRFRNANGANERILAAYKAHDVRFPVTFTLREGRGAPGPAMASELDCCKFIWHTFKENWRLRIKLNENGND